MIITQQVLNQMIGMFPNPLKRFVDNQDKKTLILTEQVQQKNSIIDRTVFYDGNLFLLQEHFYVKQKGEIKWIF